MKQFLIALTSLIAFSAFNSFASNPGERSIQSLSELRQEFTDPPAAYRPAPLYVWNDDMQEDEIARQLDEMKAGGFGGVFVHPRPGLVTPYLSDRWLELWRFTADEAAKRGMVTYIYDENSYPSGFAGGFVPDAMPEAAQVSLHRREFSKAETNQIVIDENTLALYRVSEGAGGDYERIHIPEASDGERIPFEQLNLEPDAFILYSKRWPNPSPWYGGKTFVDLMNPNVAQKFLDVTFGAYDEALSDLYGTQVLACFTDEPQVAGCWSPYLPPAFKDRWGYDILDHLPSIHSDVGEWRKVRHDYSAVILDLFMNNFVKPYYEACDERQLPFTGHVWEHGWPHIDHNPDIMSFYRWQHWPGIDCLMNNYGEGPNAQFGNYRSNKELDSIANQFGGIRRLCETYGAGGWELTLEDVKRIGDHLYAGGINLLNPHLTYYTIRGARKRDHPQSFSYHAPYWEAFHVPMNYFSRLSWALAGGRSENPILVIEPTVSMWMYNWSPSQSQTLNQRGAAFQQFITEWGASQVAFDLGSEPVMADDASVDGKQLVVGDCAYDAVVLPPGLDCLSGSTVELLKRFADNGGVIYSAVGVPPYVDGRNSDEAASIKQAAGDCWIDSIPSADDLKTRFDNGGVSIDADDPENGRVFHYARSFNDGRLVFLSNTSLDDSSSGSARVKGRWVERWNAESGEFEAVQFTLDDQSVSFDFHLPTTGSALFAIYDEDPGHETISPPQFDLSKEPVNPVSELKISAQEPNILTLDYVDLELNGETHRGLYFYDAQTMIYRAHGFDKNPWDSAVQFKDELIQQDRFPRDAGFTLHYPFNIDGFSQLPSLQAIIEQGDYYDVSINGHPLEPLKDEWRIDRAFSVYEIRADWLNSGENIISTRSRGFSLHMEPESIYLMGDFALQSIEQGFALTPQEQLTPGAWSEQGRPFYSAAVSYAAAYQFSNVASMSHWVELQDWSGTAARVDVNGETAGYILWSPWRLEISDWLRDGDNEICVTVFGSLKNLLGPHHAGELRGSAWPGSFHRHPENGQPAGNDYDVIGYGLFEPFKVY